MRLGIDLGTTRTVVAVWDGGNHPVVGFERDGGEAWEDWFPTAVAARGEGERVYGWEALERARDPEWTLLRSFKRALAEPHVTPSSPVTIGAQTLPILALLVEFLGALRVALLTQGSLPVAVAEDEVLEAVVATPAWASSAQRLITVEAFRQAGFEVLSMIHEPAAAAIHYARRWGSTLSGGRERVLVYDLGGGTFDVAIVDLSSDVYEVVGHDGLNRLGGEDFDEVLLSQTLEAAGVERGALDAWSLSTLREHCRVQKEALHPNTRRVLVELGACLHPTCREALGVDEDAVVTLDVSAYYEACRPLVLQTLDVLERALGAEGLEPIAGVFVVGGASALPVVARVLREPFGRRVHRSPYPSASAAIGLAMLGESLATGAFSLHDQLARHFGVFRERACGQDISFDVLFEAATALPEAATAPVELVRRYRAAHNVGHFRFVECTHLDALGAPSGCIAPSGEVIFAFDPTLREDDALATTPVRRLDQPGHLIEERYLVDSMGIVELSLADLDAGNVRRYTLR